ncbi:hypothetical protein [Paenibacillus ihumii]|uniref:hypothetical protein n=1 Tax=Paenibacillus ihumii TaxID=687436 RepID=UPI001CA37F62|nr:hypothetical protein [Paenibacillus ihumii]
MILWQVDHYCINHGSEMQVPSATAAYKLFLNIKLQNITAYADNEMVEKQIMENVMKGGGYEN